MYYQNNPKSKCYKNTNCIICNVDVTRNVWDHRKTCSPACYRKLVSKNSTRNPKCGGATGFKKFQYKNMWLDSSWEVEMIKWLDSKNIEWFRNRKYMFWWTDNSSKKRRYYPDFYLPKYDVYLDPKNSYKLKLDMVKLTAVQDENKIVIFYGTVEDIIQKILQLDGLCGNAGVAPSLHGG